LLDLTRTRLGGVIPLKAVRTDLQSVCEEVVLEVQASHPDAVVHFESRGDVTGQWDADRLAQVVSNLVGNAIEHGGKTPVTVIAAETGDRVRLTVHNDGDPIPPHAQANIFEPLARGTSEGTHNIGLGLFIARALVVAHGGEIRLSSTAESGTTFELLPARGISMPPGAGPPCFRSTSIGVRPCCWRQPGWLLQTSAPKRRSSSRKFARSLARTSGFTT